MNAIFFDADLSDAERRKLLYRGQLFVCSPRPSSLALVAFARKLIREAFRPLDPETAQRELPIERYAALLSDLKPRFINHARSKELIQELLADLGCDLEKTYFDVPRMRTATSDGYLTTGIAYAFHPHRDTWYSAPCSQINWWIPVYDIEPGNAMAFHPHYWDRPVRNSSRDYNYHDWVKNSRFTAGDHVKTDTRKQPKAEESVQLDAQLRVIPKPGGVLLFSGAHLHSTVPNATGRTRFSIDFRTVNFDDVVALRGATNVDSECTGTTMNDYLRGTDLARIPDEIASRYEGRHPTYVGFESAATEAASA